MGEKLTSKSTTNTIIIISLALIAGCLFGIQAGYDKGTNDMLEVMDYVRESNIELGMERGYNKGYQEALNEPIMVCVNDNCRYMNNDGSMNAMFGGRRYENNTILTSSTLKRSGFEIYLNTNSVMYEEGKSTYILND